MLATDSRELTQGTIKEKLESLCVAMYACSVYFSVFPFAPLPSLVVALTFHEPRSRLHGSPSLSPRFSLSRFLLQSIGSWSVYVCVSMRLHYASALARHHCLSLSMTPSLVLSLVGPRARTVPKYYNDLISPCPTGRKYWIQEKIWRKSVRAVLE